jgi:hypothetical protein
MRPEAIGPRLFEQACKMGWKGWFRIIGSAPMEPADRCIGSRSKTPSRPGWLAPRTGHGDLRSEGHFGTNAPNGAFAASWSFARTTSAPISQISAAMTGGLWSACPMLNRVLPVGGVASGRRSGSTTPTLIVINSGLSRVSMDFVRSAQGHPALCCEGQNAPLF